MALANKRLYEMGSDQVEAVNAISGERCNPHPHNFTDRIIRPGDQAFFDIIHSFNGYRTCYYRTFGVGSATPPQLDAYKQAREWMDGALDAIKPGVSSDVVALTLPRAQDFGFDSELAAFGLQFAHGLGLGLHERPIISRLNSLEHPVELRPGMVFAMETYCPAADGISAARIEEEVVVTDYGTEILTRFPAIDLPVASTVLTPARRRTRSRYRLRSARLVERVLQRADVALRGVGGAGDRVDLRAARRQRLGVELRDREGVDLRVARGVRRVLGGGDGGDLARR